MKNQPPSKTVALLAKLLNKRALPVRLTRKQFNWLAAVAQEENETRPCPVAINEASRGAQMAGYGEEGRIFTVTNNGVDTHFRRDYNGSGLVYD